MSPDDPNPGAGAVLFAARADSPGGRSAADGALVVLTESGIRLGAAPELAWRELVFVGMVDAGSLAGRLAGRTRRLRLELGVADAASVRERFAGVGMGSLVRFGSRAAGGARRGIVRFTVDPDLSDLARRRFVRVLFQQAESRALPQGWFESRRRAAEWRRRYVGPGAGAAGTLPIPD